MISGFLFGALGIDIPAFPGQKKRKITLMLNWLMAYSDFLRLLLMKKYLVLRNGNYGILNLYKLSTFIGPYQPLNNYTMSAYISYYIGWNK